MESIKDLIAANPSGLLQLKPDMGLQAYVDEGFDLKNTYKIYESRWITGAKDDYFAFLNKNLENLFQVQEESQGDLLVVYIVIAYHKGNASCNLILSDEAYKEILRSRKVLAVHQMYTKFFQDHITLNMVN